MMKRFTCRKKCLWLSVLVSAILMVASCSHVSSVPDKFSTSMGANVGIFADHTIAMLREAGFGFDKDEAIYIREFFDKDAPEEQRFDRAGREVQQIFERIIKYSLGLVIIAETSATEEDMVNAYADRMETVSYEMIEKLGLTPYYFKEIVNETRKQKTFFDALQVAQPAVNAFGRYMNQILDELQESTDALAAKMDTEIDQKYDRIIRYQQALEDEKYRVLDSLALLYQTYRGDTGAFDQLRKLRTVRKQKLMPKGQPTYEDLQTIADHLMVRLDTIDRIWKEVEPDWKLYRSAHKELDEKYKEGVSDIARARLVTLVWLRAHQKMAAGVVNPAEWFDIKSLPRTLIQMGAGAAL